MPESQAEYDSILLVSFGGPEGPEEVIPFLENVLRGKNVPHERMLEVAEHYQHFGGVSPINEQNRKLIAALRDELDRSQIDLPIYWGNRNWKPLLPDTLSEMRSHGKKRALAFFTSMFSSYSGCRQYRENITAAQAEIGEGGPVVDKLRKGFNHPGFIEAEVDVARQALEQLPAEERATARLLFTAHSIPLSMSDNSRYVEQLTEAAGLIAERLAHPQWELVFQSRSGPPQQAWLEPDVCDRIEELAAAGTTAVTVVPLGFISDHMEVLFDLDTEAKETCEKFGVMFSRAATVGIHPSFVGMIRQLIEERLDPSKERLALGELGASHDVCPVDCCLYPRSR